MSGGSTEPESPHDRQCPHCDRYYRDQGNSFQMHKAACDGDDGTEERTESTEPKRTEPTTTESTEQSTNDPAVSSPEQATQNPVHDSPEPPGGSSTKPTPTDKGTEEYETCPDCGGDLIDYRNHSEEPDAGFATPDDYYCRDCGQGWNA